MEPNPPILPTSNGHNDREDLRLYEMAVRKGWVIDAEWTEKLPQVAARIAADQSRPDRDRLRALELLATLRRDGVAELLELFKARRLVEGESTENISHKVVQITIE